jgi:hypothetical protein
MKGIKISKSYKKEWMERKKLTFINDGMCWGFIIGMTIGHLFIHPDSYGFIVLIVSIAGSILRFINLGRGL